MAVINALKETGYNFAKDEGLKEFYENGNIRESKCGCCSCRTGE